MKTEVTRMIEEGSKRQTQITEEGKGGTEG